MESFLLMVAVVAFLAHGLAVGSSIPDSYCYPGEACWPTLEDILLLDDSITGRVFQPMDSEYHLLSPAGNKHSQKQPAIIAQVESSSDVQKLVVFVRRFNIRLTIYSTGQENNGGSTARGSLQISLVTMDRIDINLFDSASDTGSSVRVQTGNSWGRIYEAVDAVGKVVVGASFNTVGPGGYTAGAGHGPLARMLGLAADNCIAATIVLAGGHIAFLNSTGTTLVTLGGQIFSFSYTDLFWAIRGGGGGTYGVVIDYTFKLHNPPAQLVQYIAQYPIDLIGESVINFIHQLTTTLPKQWFGMFIYSVPSVDVPSITGVILINMLHYGPWEQPTRMAIQSLEQFLPEARIMHAYINHTSFWSYAQASAQESSFRGYIAGIMIPVQKLTPALSHFYVNYAQTAPRHLNGIFYLCIEMIVGGRITELNDGSTAVSHNYRQAIISGECILSWSDPRDASVGEAFGRNMAAGLYQHSQGIYLNEAAFDLPNWRVDFWGSNYNRLLALKRMWDRDNVFYCHHCVGDDSDTQGHVPGGPTILERPAH